MDECWKVTVNRDTCIGSGVCVGTAPRHFRLDDDRSRPIAEVVDPDEDVLGAADMCPTESITVRDAAGRQLAPPAALPPLPSGLKVRGHDRPDGQDASSAGA
jgi:ferredoxin